MTPFDPIALVAMLRAFYPQVSAAALARARAERPEYFSGGVIIGSKGDKLQLPDGRRFDCIFAAGGLPGQQRWQAIDVTNETPGDDGGIVYVPGPLDLLDLDLTIPPFGDPGFEAFVGDQLGELAGSEAQLDAAREGALAFTGADALDGRYRELVEPAADAHAAIRQALDNDDPIDVVEATNSHDGEIDAARGDYVEPTPPDTPEPDPGDPPPGKGEPGGPEPPPI